MPVFSVNGKKIKCPSCWEDGVTVHTFQRILTEVKEGDDLVKVFSILTGTDYKGIWESHSEDLEAGLYQATSFIFNQPQDFRREPRPTTFHLDGKNILVPEKIGRLTVGQNFRMRQELSSAAKEGRPLESLLSIALAIYLQPIVDLKPFDMDRARVLEKEILQMSVCDVFPTAFFLLTRLQNTGPSGTMLSTIRRTLIQLLRKLRRGKSWSLTTICLSLILTQGPTGNCRQLSTNYTATMSCPSCWHGKNVMLTTDERKL